MGALLSLFFRPRALAIRKSPNNLSRFEILPNIDTKDSTDDSDATVAMVIVGNPSSETEQGKKKRKRRKRRGNKKKGNGDGQPTARVPLRGSPSSDTKSAGSKNGANSHGESSSNTKAEVPSGESHISGSDESAKTCVSQSETVRFNVGGRHFEVSRSTLDLYPTTVLAKAVSKNWKPSAVYYVDRNGDRFQYVLDWMRDGEVHLPVTESRQAIAKEFQYYGIDVMEKTIHQGTLEGGKILTTASGNVFEEIDEINQAIEKAKKEMKAQETKKHAIKAAHSLFLRAAATGEGNEITVTLKYGEDETENVKEALEKDRDFFEERLALYGLQLVSAPSRIYYSDSVDLSVKRVAELP